MGKVIGFVISALFLTIANMETVWAEETLPVLPAESRVTDELSMAGGSEALGRLESTGIYFELKDSEYLNVSLNSSELIKLTLESVPEMITMSIESAAGAASTRITIAGLTPQTTYHKYEDNYHNHEEFTTDDNGNYTYTQDLSFLHIVFIQPRKSTKFIKDDATGGNCYSIGIWDSTTKTCTLTTDLNETIQIDSDGITLDGNGHTITGSKTGNGVYVYRRTGVTIKNLTVKTFITGISIGYSSNISLMNNYVLNNSVGVNLWSSSDTTLINNTANSNGTGIRMSGAGNNTLSGNIMSGNSSLNFNIAGSDFLHYNNNIDTTNLVDGKPIYYIRSASNQIYDSTIYAGTFYCIDCNNVTIDGLTIDTNKKNSYGIYLWKTRNSTIKNVVLSNNMSGIYLVASTGNNIYSNNLSNSRGTGIFLTSSSNNAVINNTVSSSSTGIYLISSNGNTLTENNASNNGSGIYLSSSSNNIITRNNTSNSGNGIYISLSNSNTFTGNNSSSNTYGIVLFHSSYNTLSNNSMGTNMYNFSLGIGWEVPEEVFFDNNIDTSNLVDGKPMYYIRNASNQTYDATTNAGVFYCINCNNIVVDGLILANNEFGVFLWKTQNSKVLNIAASGVWTGIYLHYSSGNTLEGNNTSSNPHGVTLISSSNNVIKDSNVSNNNYGIIFDYSNSNTITGNTINSNFYFGIGLSWGGTSDGNVVKENNITNHNRGHFGGGVGIHSGSANNTIYNNNFISNAQHVGDRTIGIFNLPAPIGGNYWSDWTTPDNNGDGFVDIPFAIYSDWSHSTISSYDNLPWAKQDGWKASDGIAPTTAISLSGTLGNNNWYISAVTVTLIGQDNEGGSGVAKTEYSFDGTTWNVYTAPFTINAEGSTNVYYRSIDKTGNVETTKTQTVKIDKTLPTITAAVTPTANSNGWNNADVAITFTCIDSVSGIDQCASPITVNTDGTGPISGTVVDKAGNSTTISVIVNIDKTAPTISGAATTSPNAYGWYNAEVTVHFAASDSISGVDFSTPDVSLSTEGANQSVTGTAYDKAGNSTTTTVTGINIDKTAPVIAINSPIAAKYDNLAIINIDFTASDDLSGVYKNTLSLDGQQYDDSKPIDLLYLPLGIHTLKVESQNYAGLMATQSVDFEVIATTASLTSLITRLFEMGEIDNAGIATGLIQKLEAGQLEAFINMLEAQSGKHISTFAADILKTNALYIIGQVQL